MELVLAVCRAEPQRILAGVEEREAPLRRAVVTGFYDTGQDVRPVSRERVQTLLDELRPVHDLVRSWCGREGVEAFDEREELRTEVDRLRGMLEATAEWLKRQGHPTKAALLRREVGRRS